MRPLGIESRLPPGAARSRLMSSVRQRGTAPELAMRALLDEAGARFLSNCRELPGSPDLCDPACRLAILVHGCYWHRHARCKAASTPKTNVEFWQQKFAENVARDKSNLRKLRRLGFRIMVVWECQLKHDEKLIRLKRRLATFLDATEK
jgi:DNA mismatch endonuclease (patch repair protein)